MRKFSFFIAIFFIALAGKINAQTPATLPYSCNFNDATERSNWTLRNTTDNMLAQWFFQYEPHEEDYFLSCGDGSDWIYQPDDAPVTVYALRKFNCGDADSIKISFTYNVEGEGYHDEGKAWDYITALCVTNDAGFQAKEDSDIETLGLAHAYKSSMLFNHADGIPATLNDSVNACKLFMKNGEFTTTIKNPNPNGTATLIFAWKNDDAGTNSSNNRAGWIDDISITPITPVTYYGIRIAGIEVTSGNCNSITGSRINGSVSYNHGTKTLTLDNASIYGDISFGEPPVVQDITITLVGGENAVTGYIGTVSGTKTINGTGILETRGIYGDKEQNTIIENCSIGIGASDRVWAISGNSKLTIKNANLHAVAGDIAIGDFADIKLIGCEIVEPTNAQIIDKEFEDYSGKYVCYENGNIANKVLIKKTTGINDIVQSNNISIYPNPATNEIVISNIANNELVEIFDITGKLVKRVVYNNKINVADLQTGVYTIKINNKTQKLVIE